MSAESAVAKTVAIPRSIPPHLLMTSILEQICHSYVKDPVKAQQLFKGSYKKMPTIWTDFLVYIYFIIREIQTWLYIDFWTVCVKSNSAKLYLQKFFFQWSVNSWANWRSSLHWALWTKCGVCVCSIACCFKTCYARPWSPLTRSCIFPSSIDKAHSDLLN